MSLDVRNTDGSTVAWVLDLAGGGLLSSRDLTKTFFQVGNLITVEGFQARNGQHFAYTRTITLPNGKELNTEPETVFGGCRTAAASTTSISRYPSSAVLGKGVSVSSSLAGWNVKRT